MDITVTGRHTKVSADFHDKVLERMAKIEQLAPRATRADVTVLHEAGAKIADQAERIEITVHTGRVVRAEASAADRNDAFDKCVTKLTERLRRLHDRKASRHQHTPPLSQIVEPPHIEEEPTSVQAWEGAPEGAVTEIALDGSPISIREKTHIAPPMSSAQAIDQMELVGHDFFLFQDSNTGLPSAVYRRRGWTYGVIHVTAGDEAAAAS